MFYIRNKTTGWFMCGYSLWTPDRDVAMPFRSQVGAHAIYVMLLLQGVPAEVICETPTGGLTAYCPDIQNIPINTEEGARLRKAFKHEA